MPYAKSTCRVCDGSYQPKSTRAQRRGLCWPCVMSGRAAEESEARPRRRTCEACNSLFVVPKRDPKRFLCADCNGIAQSIPENPYSEYEKGDPVPVEPVHSLSPPMKQAVFDLETFSLDRGWGVLMVGSILVHGDGEPKMQTFTLRDTKGWPNVRSDDSELGAMILKVLSGCHIAYAHNGRDYDVPWLNSIALKYGMPRLNIKLVDPVQVARRKYRIGSNSLANLASFLGLEESKLHVDAETWRTALMDNNDESWRILVERCESDVRLLNEVSARVVGDVGMVDYSGSAWR